MSSIAHHPWCDESECYLGPDGRVVHVGHASVLDTWPVVVGVLLTDAGESLEMRLSIDSGITYKTATLCPEEAVTLARLLIRYGRLRTGALRGACVTVRAYERPPPDLRMEAVSLGEAGGEAVRTPEIPGSGALRGAPPRLPISRRHGVNPGASLACDRRGLVKIRNSPRLWRLRLRVVGREACVGEIPPGVEIRHRVADLSPVRDVAGGPNPARVA